MLLALPEIRIKVRDQRVTKARLTQSCKFVKDLLNVEIAIGRRSRWITSPRVCSVLWRCPSDLLLVLIVALSGTASCSWSAIIGFLDIAPLGIHLLLLLRRLVLAQCRWVAGKTDHVLGFRRRPVGTGH